MKIEVNKLNEEEYNISFEAEGENQQLMCEAAAGLAMYLFNVAPTASIRNIATGVVFEMVMSLCRYTDEMLKRKAEHGIDITEEIVDSTLNVVCTNFLFQDNTESIMKIGHKVAEMFYKSDVSREEDPVDE